MYCPKGLENRRSETHMLAELVPSKSGEGESVFLPMSDGLLAVFGVPWFLEVSPLYLLLSGALLLSVCLSTCAFMKTLLMPLFCVV